MVLDCDRTVVVQQPSVGSSKYIVEMHCFLLCWCWKGTAASDFGSNFRAAYPACLLSQQAKQRSTSMSPE